MKTVKQFVEGLPERIKTARVYNYKGEYLGTYDTQAVVEKYGSLNYGSAYAENFSEISLWICSNTTK